MLLKSATALAEALRRCESEPIQHIGAIQNHGALLALDDLSVVQVASANLADILGIAAQDALGQSALTVLGQRACQSVAALPAVMQQPHPFILQIQRGAAWLDCQAQAHQADHLLVIEVETPHQIEDLVPAIDADTTQNLLSALLAETTGIDAFSTIITRQLQTLTGFDRVMVYQFDHQWNGKVIAESRKPGVASLLGNHFPASDIPPPARELYTRNLVRILVDRDAAPVSLVQASGQPVGPALDLSFSVLRSMSPVHLEYLRNLGARSSMSISLLQNGRLWGLIACHHERPRQFAFKLRQSMELVAKAVAIRLAAIAFDESSRYYARVRDLLPRLAGLANLVQQTPAKTLLAHGMQQEVLGLVHATGAVIATGTLLTPIGDTPTPEQIQPLLAWLRPHLLKGQMFATHALGLEYPPGVAFAAIGSGLLAISLDEPAQHCLLWFREEVVRAMPWAGNAAKHLVEDELGPKLEPRRSFERWIQTKRGESPPWTDPEVDAARMLSLTLAELFSRQQLRVAEESRRLAASVYENSSEAMVVTDANNIILNVNPAFSELTGYSPTEAIGQTPAILNSGRHDRAFYQCMWQSLQDTGAWTGEIWNRRKNGEIYPEWLTINSIYRETGALHRRVALFTDITERKQAEAALHASEARFRGVFEKAYLGISITSLDGVIVEANDSLAKILGYQRHELIGMNVADFTYAQDLALESSHMAEVMTRQRDAFRMEKRYHTKTGALVWIDLLATVICDEHSQATSIIRMVIDISDRIRAEADLRIAATAFESQEGMTVTNAEGNILRVNQAFTKITGYNPDDVIGKNPRLLHSGRQEPAFYTEMWDRIKRTGSWQGAIWNRRKDGETYYGWLSITAVKGTSGQEVTHYVGTFTDLTDRKEAAEKIEHLAFYDHLTQLPNRRLMLDRLRQAIVNASRRHRPGAVMMIDLDNFKTLNDTAGHAVGDVLLIAAAARLLASVRAGDSVARLGGDEFAVILEDLGEGDQAALQAEDVGEKILASLGQAYLLDVSSDDQEAGYLRHFCTSSIGIALFPDDAVSANELIQRADTAMYQSKAAGRNTLRFFDPEMQAAVQARAALEIDLRRAITEGQFLLYYQAQVDARSRVIGAEALVRWQHPKNGLISPNAFIPLAEETGLILPLGQWVLETACAQLAAWATQAEMAHLTLAVNVSARQFGLPDFVERVLATVDLTGARLDRLKLELTESLLLTNTDDIVAKMTTLKSRGVYFSLDDFGTGYSSLSYLKRLPLDQLKIDQSFVRDIVTHPNDAAIAKTIVALGQNLGMTVIAEGVETAGQRNVLAGLGCLNFQGYFFSRPLPLADFSGLVRHQPS